MDHFLQLVLSRLTTHPEEVVLREEDREKTRTFYIGLNSEDVGRVIGRNGRTISSIRTLLNAAGSKTDTRVTVEIVDNDEN